MSTKQHRSYGPPKTYGTNVQQEPSLPVALGQHRNLIPLANLSDATWHRLETLIRQIVQETIREVLLPTSPITPAQPLLQVETPSLSAQVSIPRDEEEQPKKEEKPPEKPRVRFAVGTQVWEVDKDGNKVQVS